MQAIPSRCLSLALVLASSTALAQGQNYSYDDGSTENALNTQGTAQIGFLHGFDAGPGGDTIGELRVGMGTALAPANGLDGNLLILAIWDDPNNDGDPDDAVLLYQSAPTTVTDSNTDTKVSYPVSPGVPVSGIFFVGAITDSNPGEFPVGLDLSGSSPGSIAYVVADTTAVDPMNLAAASQGPISQGSTVFLLDAMGGGDVFWNSYCSPAVPNSTGIPGTLTALGSNQVSLNDLTLTTVDLPTNQFGYYITSMTQGFIPMPGGSQGNLCVVNSIGRFLSQLQNTGATGTATIDVDLTMLPQPSGAVAVMAGESWNFQLWYRDANPSATSNFSDAIEITFQ